MNEKIKPSINYADNNHEVRDNFHFTGNPKEKITEELPPDILEKIQKQNIDFWLNSPNDTNVPKTVDQNFFGDEEDFRLKNVTDYREASEGDGYIIDKIEIALGNFNFFQKKYGYDFLVHEFKKSDFKLNKENPDRIPITINDFVSIVLDLGSIVCGIKKLGQDRVTRLFTNPGLKLETLEALYEKNEEFHKQLAITSSDIYE